MEGRNKRKKKTKADPDDAKDEKPETSKTSETSKTCETTKKKPGRGRQAVTAAEPAQTSYGSTVAFTRRRVGPKAQEPANPEPNQPELEPSKTLRKKKAVVVKKADLVSSGDVVTKAKYSKTSKKPISGNEIFNSDHVNDEEREVMMPKPKIRSSISPSKFKEKIVAIFDEHQNNCKKVVSDAKPQKASNKKAKRIERPNLIKSEEVEPRVEVAVKRLVVNLMKSKKQGKNEMNVILEDDKAAPTRQPRGRVRKMKEEPVNQTAEVVAFSVKEDSPEVKVKTIKKRETIKQKPLRRPISIKRASDSGPLIPEVVVDPQPQVNNPTKTQGVLTAQPKRRVRSRK